MELQTKLDELGNAFHEFKKANDARLKEIETKGHAKAETEEKTEKLNEKISTLEGEIKRLQTAMNRTGNSGGDSEEKASEAQKKYAAAMDTYLRKGKDIPAELMAEMKFHAVNSDEDGGFFVSPQMSSEIIKQVYESSPIRQLASVQSISTDSLEIISDLDEVETGWVGETQARPETQTAKIKKLVIPVHELYAKPKATQKILDDAAVNIEAWIAGHVSEKFSRDEATAFVSGNGVGKPKGLLAYADGASNFNAVQQVETAAVGVIAPDDLIELHYALKSAYLNGSAWLAKRSVIKTFRKFKDLENRYLWEPGLNGATQATLLGFPIYEADDMPTVSNGSLPVIFGNIRQAYQIVDRIGIRTLRDPYSAKPFIEFYTTKRVGGGVKNFEAYKILRVKAS